MVGTKKYLNTKFFLDRVLKTFVFLRHGFTASNMLILYHGNIGDITMVSKNESNNAWDWFNECVPRYSRILKVNSNVSVSVVRLLFQNQCLSAVQSVMTVNVSKTVMSDDSNLLHFLHFNIEIKLRPRTRNPWWFQVENYVKYISTYMILVRGGSDLFAMFVCVAGFHHSIPIRWPTQNVRIKSEALGPFSGQRRVICFSL